MNLVVSAVVGTGKWCWNVFVAAFELTTFAAECLELTLGSDIAEPVLIFAERAFVT